MKEDYIILKRNRKDSSFEKNSNYIDKYEILSSKKLVRQIIAIHPHSKVDDDFCEVICLVNNYIVGVVYYFNTKMLVDNQIVRASTGSSLLISKKFRKFATLGIELVEQSYNPKTQFFISGGMSENAFKIHSYFGAKKFSLERYLFINNSKTIYKSFFNFKILILLLSTITNLFISLLRGILNLFVRYKISGLVIKEVNDVPDEMNELNFLNKKKYQEVHDKAWFEWVLNNSFYNERKFKKKLFTVRSRSNRLVAFFMTHEREYKKIDKFHDLVVGSVIEWETFEPHSIKEELLLMCAFRSFGKNIDIIEISTSNKKIGQILRNIGMRRKGARNVVVNFVRKSDNGKYADFFDENNWRLRPALCDTAMY